MVVNSEYRKGHLRLYNSHHVLVSWMQLRCKCGRFLHKEIGHGICHRCAKLHKREYTRRYMPKILAKNPELRATQKLRGFIRFNASKLEVGDIV